MQLKLLKEMYSKEAILKTVHLFNDDFTIDITTDEHSFILDIKSLSSIGFEEVPFLSKLQEQQLRETLNLQYGELREAIYKKAFSLVE